MIKSKIKAICLAVSACLFAYNANAQANSQIYNKNYILKLSEKVADYQIATLAGGEIPLKASGDTPEKKGWVQGALFIGFTELADFSKEPRYKQVIFSRGVANDWKLGNRKYHADDHMIGQTYLWAYKNGAGEQALRPMIGVFDEIIANPSKVELAYIDKPKGQGQPTCLDRWCWCDAIFMSPAALFEVSKITKDKKYADFAKQEFWVTTEYLFDKEENLYFRDSRFFDKRDDNGKKLFWSRGNGWVFAGLARIIPLLENNDPDKAQFVDIYKKMAKKLITIQKADGYWSPSLLSDPSKSLPESSGTGFYVYGLAWGVNNGLLPRKEYEPAIKKGWAALVKSIHPNGRLGYVQPVSDRPESVEYNDTQYYGVGAFLLAATEVSKMNIGAKK